MSKEIIEKMAKDSGCPSRQPCKECLLLNECDRRLFAERLYNKNYREQSVGKWIFGKLGGRGAWVCSLCGAGFTGENAEWIANEHDFCPRCGAKMKGGAE